VGALNALGIEFRLDGIGQCDDGGTSRNWRRFTLPREIEREDVEVVREQWSDAVEVVMGRSEAMEQQQRRPRSIA
jgi:hypothetical protein